jgi:outer membrane scaffolding protein for murein synthesis (MipA/OmpV family)
VVLAPLAGPIPKWRVTVGGGAIVQPEFEGAKSYDVEPSPIIDIRYRDLFFLSDGEGIGVNLLRGKNYRAGVALAYDLGRDTHDDPHVRNLPNIAPSPEPKLFAQYFLLPVVLTADLRKAIGGVDGLIGDIGAYVPLPIAHETYLFVGPSVTFANRRYMETDFGVGAGAAASSGLPQFAAHGGFKNATIGASVVHMFDAHWLFIGQGAYERLLGSAEASPISETRAQFVLDLDLGYQF